MAKLTTLRPTIRTFDARAVRPELKTVDPIYNTPEYGKWRARVIARAGGRCQVIEAGMRCTKAKPQHRMYAHHIKELRDGGSPFDPANGLCICASHHTTETAKARTTRLGSQSR